jgi:excisionase family DNA binding protein
MEPPVANTTKPEPEPDTPPTSVMRLTHIATDLDVSMDVVYDMAKSGALPAFKVGSQWRITPEAYAQWKADQAKAAERRARYAMGL